LIIRKVGDDLEDYKIVEMICLGDESAIDECSKKYGGELLAISQRITGSKEDAGECLNDTLLQAWKTVPRVKPRNLRYYLIRIVRNISLDKVRRANSKKRKGLTVAFDELSECLPDNCSYISLTDEENIAADINSWLLTLSDERRAVFVRRYYLMESVRDIAKEFGIKEKTLSGTLTRLRSSLKSYLEEKGHNI